jgi:hypothetical protein
MPLTREFKDTVQARIKQDRKYRKELLREGVESLLAGDLDTGKAILRDYINATIGFEELSRVTKRPTKSLMRMFGPAGNPQARNLFEVIGHLQRAEGLQFELSLKAASQTPRPIVATLRSSQRLLHRVLAFTKLRFSNSMIEAWWRFIKTSVALPPLVGQPHHGQAIGRVLRPGTQPGAATFGVSPTDA